MVRKTLSMPEIRREGLAALVERPGSAGAVRFLRMLTPGEGNYTQDRHVWLDGLTAAEIGAEIQEQRGAGESN